MTKLTNDVKFIVVVIVLMNFTLINSDLVPLPRNYDDFNQFLDNDFASFPKCCPLDSSLLVTDYGLNCTTREILSEHFQIYASIIATNESNFLDSCENIECVDFLKNETEWHLARMFNCDVKTIYKKYLDFPKCCPYDFLYNHETYSCVPHNRTVYEFGQSLQVINVSLPHCPSRDYATTDFQDEFVVNTDKSVTLANGRRFVNGRFCIDNNYQTGKNMIRGCLEFEEACVKMKRRCITKCCRDGEAYKRVGNKPICLPEYTLPFNVSGQKGFDDSDNEYGIVHGASGVRYLDEQRIVYHVDGAGTVFVYDMYEKWKQYTARDQFYCVDNWKGELYTFLFVRPNTNDAFKPLKFQIGGIVLALSCVFLLLTIICYLFLPEMQNVHGRLILFFCIFMFFACSALCFAQLYGPHLPVVYCAALGFTIIFTFLAAFAWMNVICFDMWMAFGTMRVLNLNNKRKDLKKLLWYNLYATGIPIFICGFAVIVYLTRCFPEAFIPHVGEHKCFFDKTVNTYDSWVYFVLPQFTMIIINLVFFIKTSKYCYKVKNEIQKMRGAVGENKEAKQRKFNDDKEKLLMLFKLFLVMGIPWTFEVITTVFPFTNSPTMRIIETCLDCLNAGQGIIIFCIFILKKKVWISIKTRLGMVPMRRVSELSTGITNDITSGNGSSNGNSTRRSGKEYGHNRCYD